MASVAAMDSDSAPVGRLHAALSGVLAVAVTLGIAELVAGLLSDGRSLVIAVGDTVIDLVPGWLERAVISTLGTWDKPFLIVNIVVVSALLGALLGILSVRRFPIGAAGLAVMAAVGVAASLADPQAGAVGPVAAGIVGACAGIRPPSVWAGSTPSARSSAIVAPSMIRAAALASGTPVALATNGTVREARGLASST